MRYRLSDLALATLALSGAVYADELDDLESSTTTTLSTETAAATASIVKPSFTVCLPEKPPL